ncbi:MAG TPA: hypothetical protein VE422_48580 [Terriglobia bacterium]|nr:hypothetical protein [Terriglobia bacterium]
MRRTGIAFVILAAVALPCVAQTPPDWSGYYTLASGKDLGNFKPLNVNLPEVIAAHLQPWAKAKMAATDGIAEDTGQLCQPTGIFRNPPFAGSFLWLPGPEKIVIVYGALNTAGVQRIYLNRSHPRNLPPTWNGHSIGRWEGDTLLVDTIGFNDKSWLQPTMEPHTEEARLIQRIRQVGNGDFIEIHYTVEDRKALTSAYSYSRYYKKVGESMRENVCNDDIQIWRDFKSEHLKPIIERSREVRQP